MTPSAALPMTLSGLVRHGDARGRMLGFPTANVDTGDLPLPAFGVYAGVLDGRPAAISIGVRPTFGDGLLPLLEAYVLDFDGDLYDRVVTVTVLAKLRDELRFTDTQALIEQIRLDVARVRELVVGRPG